MRIFHLSDLHIGLKLINRDLREDQEYILNQIVEAAAEQKPDAIVIAGDIYDKAIPSTDAVQLFDDFLVKLSYKKLQTFIISGNHDSAERIAFASRIMDVNGIHLSPVYNGEIKPISMNDEYGEVDIYMLPFIKPLHVRKHFEDESVKTYTDAVRAAIENMNVDTSKRTLLITHQFVTGALTSDSEEISVGGTDNVDSCVFEPFDYVALGHIHGPQHISRETIRYCGTPLKYSFSEENHKKSVTVVEMKEKGAVEIRTVELIPKHDMRTVRGTYDEVMSKDFYINTNTEDYVRIILTDEYDIPNAMNKLRTVYKNIMVLEYDNARTRSSNIITGASVTKDKPPLELFADFYEEQNNCQMSDVQYNFMQSLIEKVSEGDL